MSFLIMYIYLFTLFFKGCFLVNNCRSSPVVLCFVGCFIRGSNIKVEKILTYALYFIQFIMWLFLSFILSVLFWDVLSWLCFFLECNNLCALVFFSSAS